MYISNYQHDYYFVIIIFFITFVTGLAHTGPRICYMEGTGHDWRDLAAAAAGTGLSNLYILFSSSFIKEAYKKILLASFYIWRNMAYKN